MELRSREEWGASYDVSERPRMTGLPVRTVYIHHSVTDPTDDPNADMVFVEQIDIGKFGVPSYSWVIHPSGLVLEGMGVHRGAHTKNNANQSQNNVAFGICFLGNFENDVPTPEALRAGGELVAYLAGHDLLADGWQLKGHRDVYATACPGRNLYPLLPELLAPPGDDMTPEQAAVLNDIAAHVKNDLPALFADLKGHVTELERKVAALQGGTGPSPAGQGTVKVTGGEITFG